MFTQHRIEAGLEVLLAKAEDLIGEGKKIRAAIDQANSELSPLQGAVSTAWKRLCDEESDAALRGQSVMADTEAKCEHAKASGQLGSLQARLSGLKAKLEIIRAILRGANDQITERLAGVRAELKKEAYAELEGDVAEAAQMIAALARRGFALAKTFGDDGLHNRMLSHFLVGDAMSPIALLARGVLQDAQRSTREELWESWKQHPELLILRDELSTLESRAAKITEGI